jgi:hypothetical protein
MLALLAWVAPTSPLGVSMDEFFLDVLAFVIGRIAATSRKSSWRALRLSHALDPKTDYSKALRAV